MPGVDLHTTGGTSQAGLNLSEQFVRYASHSELNSNLPSLAGNFAYDSGPSKLTLASSYQEMDQSNLQSRNISQTVSHNLTDASANGSFGLTAKTGLGLGASFERTTYPQVGLGYVDNDVWSLPIDLYYAVTPKVDLSLGYNFRDTSSANSGFSSKDSFYNVGARGSFTPKLSGQIRVGVTQRRFNGGGSESQLGLGTTLTYLLTPKTSFDLTVSNDFNNSAFGSSQKVLSIGLNGQFALTQAWSVQSGVSYDATKYLGGFPRSDKFWVGNLGASYALTLRSALQLSYLYRKNSSNVPVNFSDNVVSLSASIRF
jgi:hypothetical protein